MPRSSRVRSKSGIYHVMVRGINKQDIFRDNEDRGHYLKTLASIARERACKVYAYCLMANHIHLLLAEGQEPLGETMKRLGVSYVYWYNQKYERVGHLFQDRFRSEPVDDDTYFLTVLRYIHQNPVQARLVATCQDYFWSSYRDYLGEKAGRVRVVDTDFGLNMVGGVGRFIEFNHATSDARCLDVEESARRLRDADLRAAMLRIVEELEVDGDLQQLDQARRNEVLRQLKLVEGASVRQIARVTGLGKTIVERA